MKNKRILEAEINSKKHPKDLKKGDFIFVIAGGRNCDNYLDWLNAKKKQFGDRDIKILCKIDDIAPFHPNYHLLRCWTTSSAIKKHENNNSEYKTVLVFWHNNGHYIAIDSENSDIWEYVYLPVNYKELYKYIPYLSDKPIL